MSKPRKSSAALAAREKARAKAEEMTRRNEELIELAAGFFVYEDKLSQIEDDTEQKIAQLRALAEEKKAATMKEAIAVVEKMLQTGESKKSIAERLGLTPVELKRRITNPLQELITEEKPSETKLEAASSSSDVN